MRIMKIYCLSWRIPHTNDFGWSNKQYFSVEKNMFEAKNKIVQNALELRVIPKNVAESILKCTNINEPYFYFCCSTIETED